MKKIHNEKGFTLIEMMIVLMIISILLLIAIPNMTKNNEVAQSKGCEATIGLLQAQVGAYHVEHNRLPSSIEDLKDYVETTSCPNGAKLEIINGKVQIENET